MSPRALLVCVACLVLATTVTPAPGAPFSGWLRVHLVADSIWEHCELEVAVDEEGKGTQEVSCRSGEGKEVFRVESPLGSPDIGRVRQLLRSADLFQGQFWGSDLRGIDAPFVTLAVNDESRAAVLVCWKNESFDTGARRELFVWLSARIAAERERHRSK